MTTDQMTTIPQGYRWPNGLVLTPAETDAYNLFQTKIEAVDDESIRRCIRHRRRQFIRDVSQAAGIRISFH